MDRKPGRLICMCALLQLIGPVSSISQRKIFTLFTQKKTWNEARDLCASQFGQLFKLETDRQKFELQSLDAFTWNGVMSSSLLLGDPMWIGLHRPSPSPNDTTTHQDCEEYDPTGNSLSAHGTGRCGAVYNNLTSIHFIDCNEQGTFVCERIQDDCWFEPFIEFNGFNSANILSDPTTAVDVNECALFCRDYLLVGEECWGLYYDSVSTSCQLFKVTLSLAEDSSYLMDRSLLNTLTGSENVLYIRRCFEGLLDDVIYPDYVNTDVNAIASDCSVRSYQDDSTANDICFCSVDTQPPIPAPISVEDRAAELVAELTIESSNTSAAQRKLTSAEDNRPSAISVGAVGVALLSIVFGGLMLMDLNVAIVAMKKMVAAFMSKGASTAAAGPPTGPSTQ